MLMIVGSLIDLFVIIICTLFLLEYICINNEHHADGLQPINLIKSKRKSKKMIKVECSIGAMQLRTTPSQLNEVFKIGI